MNQVDILHDIRAYFTMGSHHSHVSPRMNETEAHVVVGQLSSTSV